MFRLGIVNLITYQALNHESQKIMPKTSLDEKYQLDPDPPLSENAKQYLGYLLDSERRQAQQFINELNQQGTSLREIYLDVFQRTQREIGYLWETNQISVAEEHFCTASTQMTMAQLYPLVLSDKNKGRTVLIACVGGELHELGARMVADFFEMDGWETYYIGANTPADTLIETIQKKQPDLVGLSVTMTFNFPEVQGLVERINHEVSIEGKDMRIIVGGRPFNVAPDMWKKLDGVDGYAEDVEAAIDLANELVKEEGA